MDIKELKELIKKSTSVLIIDQGEPSLVIMDYGVYKGLVKDEEKEVEIKHTVPENDRYSGRNGSGQLRPIIGPASVAREAEILERLNKEILVIKEQIEVEERKAQGVELE